MGGWVGEGEGAIFFLLGSFYFPILRWKRASRSSAGHLTCDAAGDATGHAPGDAAGDAPGDAAGDATGDAAGDAADAAVPVAATPFSRGRHGHLALPAGAPLREAGGDGGSLTRPDIHGLNLCWLLPPVTVDSYRLETNLIMKIVVVHRGALFISTGRSSASACSLFPQLLLRL